ncbi:MAG: hypothetical protein HQM12_23245, partial [SAR324 cluster bacterium]|nr:hypothetical protein [SAR324 cluster bacterium]
MIISKKDFMELFVKPSSEVPKAATAPTPDLPDEAFSFEDSTPTEEPKVHPTAFVLNLLEKSYGNTQYLPREEIILGKDPSFKYLPKHVYFWDKIPTRPFFTLFLELEMDGAELLQEKLFKGKLDRFDDLQSALSRFVQMALDGFNHGGDQKKTEAKKGKPTETLCILSVSDHRQPPEAPSHLVCFGTVVPDPETSGLNLEVFFMDGASQYWDQPIREDYLTSLYEKHYKRLEGSQWQEAFITGIERKMAGKLLEICIAPHANEKKLEEAALDLMDEIAKNFGLRKSPNKARRLQTHELPEDHDIGIDSESKEKHGNRNPFKGISIRDDRNRLLGYIVYCLDNRKDAELLSNHLKNNNRFHNVLVIYPENNQARLELWQGKEKLEGKLTKQGKHFAGAGEVVNLLARFFVVSQAKAKDPKALAEELAYRARFLRKLALKQLMEEKTEGDLRD